MTDSLNDNRWNNIRSEVHEYLDPIVIIADFDIDGIVDAVGKKHNSIDDVPDEEWEAILEANDRVLQVNDKA